MTTEAPRKPRPSLGRGLNALLGDIAPEAVPTVGGGETPAGIRMLPVGALTPQPGQPRRVFDEASLEELAQSIAARACSSRSWSARMAAIIRSSLASAAGARRNVPGCTKSP